jgi:hypothetical protein
MRKTFSREIAPPLLLNGPPAPFILTVTLTFSMR